MSDERGVALLMTLLVLIIVTTLVAGMTFSGRTEVLVSRNYETAAVAMGAAEGGLYHAVEITSAYLANWQANGFGNASAAVTALLVGPDNTAGTADDGCLVNLGIPCPPAQTAMGTAFGAGYEARVYDEDDPNRGVTLSAADLTRIGEPAGNPTTDQNSNIVVQAIGYGPDNTSVTLEATLRPIPLPAIVTNGPLAVRNDARVLGTEGSVHSNDDLSITDDDVFIAKDATASGSFSNNGGTVVGQSGGGFAEKPVPAISAVNYKSNADYVLTSDGRITDLAGNLVCSAQTNPNNCEYMGWRFPSGNEWRVQGSSVIGGTYYAETRIRVLSSPVSTTGTLTLIATGSIEITGSPTVLPDTTGLLAVTDGDLRITSSGVFGAPGFEGQMLVHGQVRVENDVQIYGQILAEDTLDAGSPNIVANNDSSIRNDTRITYNGSFTGSNGFELSAWREVR